MVALGNFLFQHRNWFFPLFYVLLFLPSPVLMANPTLAFLIGVSISALGQITRGLTIGFVYIFRGGDANKQIHAAKLYTNGLMAHVRNPLYIGNILILLGMGIAANSILFLGLVFPIFVVFYQAIVLAEEQYLASQFGDSYQTYIKQIHRWIPNFDNLGKTFNEMEFSWKRAIKAEYNPTFLWIMGAFLIAIKQYLTLPEIYDIRTATPTFIGIFVLLLISYLTIRSMKKARRFDE